MSPHNLTTNHEPTIKYGLGPSFEETFSSASCPGASIGGSGSDGTLGAYLKLDITRINEGILKTETKILALSAHHVVSPDRDDAIDGSRVCLDVHQPALTKQSAWVERLKRNMQRLQQRIASPTTPERTAMLVAEFNDVSALLGKAEYFSTHFGKVFCTSGLTVSSILTLGRIAHLEWALIEVDASRLGDDSIPITNRPAPHVLDELARVIKRHDYVEAARSEDERVFKIGAASATTIGFCNGTCALVRTYGEVEYHVIANLILPDVGFSAFSAHGDSGAVIRAFPDEGEHKAIGLLYSGFKNETPSPSDAVPPPATLQAMSDVRFHHSPEVDLRGMTLYTPMDHIMESMRAGLMSMLEVDGAEVVHLHLELLD